jgi:cyanophycin synthetase
MPAGERLDMSRSLTLTRMEARRGPGLEADWPCLVLGVAAAGWTMEEPVPDHVVAALARGLGDEAFRTSCTGLRLPALAGRLILALQAAVGPVLPRFSVARTPGGFRLVLGCRDPEIAAAAVPFALRWLTATAEDAAAQADLGLAAFERATAAIRLTLENRLLVEEAVRRDIPWSRLYSNHVQLGQGCRQRWLYQQFTDATPALGVALSTAKPAAAQIMAAAGVPVPQHVVVEDEAAAVEAALRIGFPVVLKPASRDLGVGVHLDVGSAEAVRQVFPAVRQHGAVLVERQQPGLDHRLLILDGRMIAAARRVPAGVVGDGQRTIRALVEAANADPRRGVAHSAVLERIVIDDEVERVLAAQGLSPDSIPAAGRAVQLRRTANISTGGTGEDVTASVHPENRAMAERAAQALRLDLAGVDFITTDIARSHLEVGGVVCEVNCTPGFRPHLSAPGSPDVVRLVMEGLFPAGTMGRIPTAMVTGTNGKTTTCRMVAAILRAAGRRTGLASTDGVEIDGMRIAAQDLAGPRGAQMLLRDATVEAAVLETARGGILRHGLGINSCSVGALLNIGSDHVGSDGIETPEDLARIKSRVLLAARAAAVVNADDPRCMAAADASRARRLILVSRHPGGAALVRHLEAGGLAVMLAGGEPGRIVAREGRAERLSIEVALLPAAHGGAAAFNVDNAMFAAAIGLGLGLPPAAVAAGLAGFRPDTTMSSGRANRIGGWPFDILVDYAHNDEALTALGRFVAKLPVAGRRLVTLVAAGNRPDASYAGVAAAAAPWFDHFICGTETPRGRPTGEVGRLLAEGLRRAGIPDSRIEVAEPYARAFDRILAEARPGDLAVIVPGDPRPHIEQLLRMGGRDWSAAS